MNTHKRSEVFDKDALIPPECGNTTKRAKETKIGRQPKVPEKTIPHPPIDGKNISKLSKSMKVKEQLEITHRQSEVFDENALIPPKCGNTTKRAKEKKIGTQPKFPKKPIPHPPIDGKNISKLSKSMKVKEQLEIAKKYIIKPPKSQNNSNFLTRKKIDELPKSANNALKNNAQKRSLKWDKKRSMRKKKKEKSDNYFRREDQILNCSIPHGTDANKSPHILINLWFSRMKKKHNFIKKTHSKWDRKKQASFLRN